MDLREFYNTEYRACMKRIREGDTLPLPFLLAYSHMLQLFKKTNGKTEKEALQKMRCDAAPQISEGDKVRYICGLVEERQDPNEHPEQVWTFGSNNAH